MASSLSNEGQITTSNPTTRTLSTFVPNTSDMTAGLKKMKFQTSDIFRIVYLAKSITLKFTHSAYHNQGIQHLVFFVNSTKTLESETFMNVNNFYYNAVLPES